MQGFFRTAALLCAFVAALAGGSAARGQAVATREPIKLFVDASDAPQKILHVQMQIPVKPGPLSLYYPEWIPGEHMPDGPIIEMAGLKFTADGKTIPWRRDLVEMYTFHLEIPPGVTALDVNFDFLLSAPAAGFSAGASATANLDVLSWNQVLLYPAGATIRDWTFVPTLKLPAGWQFGTALPIAKRDGDRIEFQPVPLDTLVDSPVLSGRYFKKIQLTPGQVPPHEMDLAADSSAALAMLPETEVHFHSLVDETGVLFGTRHYRDYHFLVTLSDDVAHFGLEHHESSDDRTYERSLIDPRARLDFANLLPHEFVHSWNGKYRRPAGLATPDYQQPMKDDLLWVYEGLTEYLGNVLTARSGLLSMEDSREALALVAATLDAKPGREWRPLQDTADAAPFLYDAGGDWANWRRGTDFYEEGEMLWLDVDTTLRRLTNDQKSMNDFCRIFHGGEGGRPELKIYTFEDVVSTLNGLAPFDWASFLRAHLDSTSAKTPSEAVENSGWKIVYNEQPNSMQETGDELGKRVDESFSIGLIAGEDGMVIDVMHGSPAYKAGFGPGMKIVAVNSHPFGGDSLDDAILDAESDSHPIEMIVQNGADFRTFPVDYHGGLRFPHLIRDESKPDYLSEILHPQAHWVVK
jgi:predicted metalloprotease with PDZ domain